MEGLYFLYWRQYFFCILSFFVHYPAFKRHCKGPCARLKTILLRADNFTSEGKGVSDLLRVWIFFLTSSYISLVKRRNNHSAPPQKSNCPPLSWKCTWSHLVPSRCCWWVEYYSLECTVVMNFTLLPWLLYLLTAMAPNRKGIPCNTFRRNLRPRFNLEVTFSCKDIIELHFQERWNTFLRNSGNK